MDLSTFAEAHGTTEEKLRTFLRDNRRQLDLRDVFKELSYRSHECVICGHVVESKRGRGNTNFGRTSHIKKHVNAGEAFNPWNGGTEGYVMPSEAELEEMLAAAARERVVAKERPKLVAERKPFVTELKRLRKERDGYEMSLQTAIRKYGPEASKVDVTFNSYATEVQSLTRQIEEHQAELRAVEGKYDEDVVGSLTMGDGF